MTLRAVDLQVVLPRAQEVARIQQVVDQAHQQVLAGAFQQFAEAARVAVQQLPEAAEARVRERKEKMKNQKEASAQGSRKSREGEEHLGVPQGELRGSVLDLKV